jgi:hypothetical protein
VFVRVFWETGEKSNEKPLWQMKMRWGMRWNYSFLLMSCSGWENE